MPDKSHLGEFRWNKLNPCWYMARQKVSRVHEVKLYITIQDQNLIAISIKFGLDYMSDLFNRVPRIPIHQPKKANQTSCLERFWELNGKIFSNRSLGWKTQNFVFIEGWWRQIIKAAWEKTSFSSVSTAASCGKHVEWPSGLRSQLRSLIWADAYFSFASQTFYRIHTLTLQPQGKTCEY